MNQSMNARGHASNDASNTSHAGHRDRYSDSSNRNCTTGLRTRRRLRSDNPRLAHASTPKTTIEPVINNVAMGAATHCDGRCGGNTNKAIEVNAAAVTDANQNMPLAPGAIRRENVRRFAGLASGSTTGSDRRDKERRRRTAASSRDLGGAGRIELAVHCCSDHTGNNTSTSAATNPIATNNPNAPNTTPSSENDRAGR